MSLEATSALKKFFLELNEEVESRSDANATGVETLTPAVALAQVMLEYLEEEGVISEAQMCQFADASGRRRCAVTAYSLDENEDRLDLFVSEFVVNDSDIPLLPASELSTITGKVARFFDYASKADFERFTGSPETLDAARRIHGALKRLSTVRMFVLTNAQVRDRDVQGLEVAGLPVQFEIVDIERLLRISKSSTSRQDIQIDFVALCGRPLACLEMSPRAPDYDTYLAIVPAKLLFDLYERYGQRLFEFNVRSFLQAKGKVNKGIRDTLRDFPDRFMAYNNGIVATADHLEVGQFHGETTISKAIGLQIVNGAQTTASIHRAKKIDKIDLSRVSVAVKITKVASEKLQEFVPLISQFANTQNVIQAADLSANNAFHIELERLSQEIWCPGEESRWFYERARGAYQDALQREGSTLAKRREFKIQTPTTQKITKTDLAKYLMTWMGRPHTVSMGAQKNFSIFMSELPELFASDWKPDHEFYRRCIAQAILFRCCERIVRLKKFAAYRANIAVYMYALLSHCSKGEVDFNRVWSTQGISPELEALLAEWSHRVDETIRSSAGAKNVTEWCKKPECWDAVRSISSGIPAHPPPELVKNVAAARAPAELEVEVQDSQMTDVNRAWSDEDSIEECMQHDAATWAKLNFWGISTNALDYYERGVSHTLSEYAASKWVKKPSPKQARIGIRVLHRARDAGMLA
jgi:hypothetical protein